MATATATRVMAMAMAMATRAMAMAMAMAMATATAMAMATSPSSVRSRPWSRPKFNVTPPEPLQASCSIQGESESDSEYEMVLDCEGSEVSITIDSTIPVKPHPSGTMALDYRVEGEQRWLALQQTADTEALVLGGVSAASLDPPGTTLAALFGDPGLHVADEQPCEIMPDACGDSQRLALAVDLDWFGPGDPVFDQGSWYANFLAFGYAIEVERARVVLDPCPEQPAAAFELLVTWFPSD